MLLSSPMTLCVSIILLYIQSKADVPVNTIWNRQGIISFIRAGIVLFSTGILISTSYDFDCFRLWEMWYFHQPPQDPPAVKATHPRHRLPPVRTTP